MGIAAVTSYDAFERLCTQAVACDRCFPAMGVARSFVDVAQPRYVGPGYWAARERRVFLLTNPGAGDEEGSPSDRAMRQDILEYRGRRIGLEDLFERQRQYLSDWGRGKFLKYLRKVGASLNDIALLNVAWCATRRDKYPGAMLSACWSAHTQRALAALAPTIVVACGVEAQKFAARGGLSFVPAPHPSARFAIDFDAIKMNLVGVARDVAKELLATVVSSLDQASSPSDDRQSARAPRAADQDIIRLISFSNPKKGKSAERFDCYRDRMTVSAYRTEVARRLGRSEAAKCLADLRWDAARNFIRIEPH